MQSVEALRDGVAAEGLDSPRSAGWLRIVRHAVAATPRLWVQAAVFAMELVPISALPHPWLRARTFAPAQIFFWLSLLFFGRKRLRAEMELGRLGSARGGISVDRRFAILHGLALAGFFAASGLLLRVPMTGSAHAAVLTAWWIALALVPLTLVAALFSLRGMASMLGGLGSAWGYAAVCGLLTLSARTLLQAAWDAPGSRLGQAMQAATFRGTAALLALFYPEMISDPRAAVLGTARFTVRIGSLCSGIEGCALMLGLTVAWLVCMRRELRLERALLLVAPSLVLMFGLNIVRIALLVAIGDAGYEAVAVGGFHSEAGWLLFSAVAMGFLTLVSRLHWLRVGGDSGLGSVGNAAAAEGTRNVTAVYLMPLLAITAASLISRMSSAGFEWLYGLRVVAVLAAMWVLRGEYRTINWRFGWLGPAAGVCVAAAWIGWSHWMGAAGSNGIAEGLARLSSAERFGWIALRMVGAVVAVPLAEELAFRGWLARRMMSADVESVSCGALSLVAVAGSSVAFGLMHGRMWLVGMVAGIVFAVVAKLRGRLGEAIAAHAVANLLIAVWVLARSDYLLW